MKIKIFTLAIFILFVSGMSIAQPALLKDINPGPNSSIQFVDPHGFINGYVIFSADDGIHGKELWRTDGTAQNTVMVKDIYEGTESSGPGNFIEFNDKLVFYAEDSLHGAELWITDGTEAGTQLIKDIMPGTGSSIFNSRNFAVYNDKLYFSADDGEYGFNLWESDGTEQGTIRVNDIGNQISRGKAQHIIAFKDSLFFSTERSGSRGAQLMISDGTNAGTRILKDINPGGYSSEPANLIAAEDWFYFSARTADEGHELWKSDGTEAGTVFVKEIWPGNNSAQSWQANNSKSNYTTIGNNLFFVGRQSINGSNEVWFSDGTEAGTIQLTNFNDEGSNVMIEAFQPFGNGILFAGGSNQTGVELYYSDGTVAGTRLVKDVYPGNFGGLNNFTRFYPYLGRMAFVGRVSSGSRIYLTDGTEEGTTVFYSGLGSKVGNNQNQLMVMDSTIFYFASESTTGIELWSYEFEPFNPSLEITGEIRCNGDNNGRLAINAKGGYSPFEYEWSDSNISSPTPSSLGPGVYTVTVKDWDGTEIQLSTEILEPEPIEISADVTNASTGSNNGIIVLNVTGGTSPYSYLWSNGLGNSSEIDNLDAGIYTCVVTDDNNCKDTIEVEVKRTSSIIEFEKAGIQMYPSPTSDVINIILPEAMEQNAVLEIISIDQKLHSKVAVHPGSNTISVSDLPNGFYISKIKMNNSLYQSRFIKQ
ncbi:MAG: T9SS type A sorting domain-containing protein [Saprospiraceae bacterium]